MALPKSTPPVLRRTSDDPDGEQCQTLKQMDTPSNSVVGVPPHAGIMFDVFTGEHILDLLTLEFDVHIQDLENMEVQVYSREGSFDSAIGNSAAWEQLADTTLVQAPEGGGGVIVPVQDFKTLRMQPRQRRSFYITMKDQVINSPAQALQKTGDIAQRGDDMDVFVGLGFNEHGFPSNADNVVDPQFAGTIHYKRLEDCRESVTHTFARFYFLSEGDQPDQTLSDQMDAAMEAAMANILASDPQLQQYVETFSLQTTGTPRIITTPFQGVCPKEWNGCNLASYSRSISFLHLSGLDSNVLLHSLYRYGAAIRSTLPDFIGSGVSVEYIGLESVKVPYSVKLAGVSWTQLTDDEISFFKAITLEFLTSSFESNPIDIFDVTVTDHEQLQPGEVEITGEVLAGQPAFFDTNDLASRVRSQFKNGEEEFIEAITRGGYRPGRGNTGDGFQFFTSVSDIGSKVGTPSLLTVSELSTSDDSGPHRKALAIGGLVGGGLVLFVALFYLIKSFRRGKQYHHDVEDSRANRRKYDKIQRMKSHSEAEQECYDEYQRHFSGGNPKEGTSCDIENQESVCNSSHATMLTEDELLTHEVLQEFVGATPESQTKAVVSTETTNALLSPDTKVNGQGPCLATDLLMQDTVEPIVHDKPLIQPGKSYLPKRPSGGEMSLSSLWMSLKPLSSGFVNTDETSNTPVMHASSTLQSLSLAVDLSVAPEKQTLAQKVASSQAPPTRGNLKSCKSFDDARDNIFDTKNPIVVNGGREEKQVLQPGAPPSLSRKSSVCPQPSQPRQVQGSQKKASHEQTQGLKGDPLSAMYREPPKRSSSRHVKRSVSFGDEASELLDGRPKPPQRTVSKRRLDSSRHNLSSRSLGAEDDLSLGGSTHSLRSSKDRRKLRASKSFSEAHGRDGLLRSQSSSDNVEPRSDDSSLSSLGGSTHSTRSSKERRKLKASKSFDEHSGRDGLFRMPQRSASKQDLEVAFEPTHKARSRSDDSSLSSLGGSTHSTQSSKERRKLKASKSFDENSGRDGLFRMPQRSASKQDLEVAFEPTHKAQSRNGDVLGSSSHSNRSQKERRKLKASKSFNEGNGNRYTQLQRSSSKGSLLESTFEPAHKPKHQNNDILGSSAHSIRSQKERRTFKASKSFTEDDGNEEDGLLRMPSRSSSKRPPGVDPKAKGEATRPVHRPALKRERQLKATNYGGSKEAKQPLQDSLDGNLGEEFTQPLNDEEEAPLNTSRHSVKRGVKASNSVGSLLDPPKKSSRSVKKANSLDRAATDRNRLAQV